jgi:hypothetical protein
MGKLRQLFSTFLAIGILAVCALAQTNLTQIRDTITNPDGTPFNGTLVVTWVGLSTPTSGDVSPLSTSARIYNGALSVLLVPTTTAAAGSYYRVVYYSSDATVTWTETWSVPPSTNVLSVGSVRTSTTSGSGGSTGTGGPPAGGTQYATLPLALSQITGLSDDLNTINTSLASLQSTVNALGSGSGSGGNLTTLTNAVNGLTTTVNGLSTSNSTNTTNIALLTSTVNNLSAGSVSNNSSISALNTTVGNLGTSVSSLGATVAALQSGGTPATVNVTFVDGQTPSGTTNGSNAVFILSQVPTPAASLELYRNGLVQTSGVDFAISSSTITFFTGDIPAAGDLLQAYYRTPGSSTLPNFADNEVPTGAVNGTNLTFMLAYAPNPIVGLRLYKNGLLLLQHGDYTVNGSTITFVAANGPQTGDAVVAYYRH